VVPQYTTNKVVEFDANGKAVWQSRANRPTAVRRLPSGHTVIGTRLGRRVWAVDKAGTEVWGRTVDGRVLFVDVR
jgi:hypothetical protein